jgi:hypothetical protein
MPGITDIGPQVLTICKALYDYLTAKEYSSDEIKEINALRSAWSKAFGNTGFPVELRFAGESADPKDNKDTSSKKPAVIPLERHGDLSIHDFSLVTIEKLGDNALMGQASCGADLILSYINERRKRFFGSGTDWDPHSQFCHLVAGFCLVVPKINLDDSETLKSLEQWILFIGIVRESGIFEKGFRSRYLAFLADTTMRKILSNIWVLFTDMKKIVENIQKQKASREFLGTLSTSLKNACNTAVKYSGFVIAENEVHSTLNIQTLANTGLDPVNGYGSTILHKITIQFAKSVFDSLNLNPNKTQNNNLIVEQSSIGEFKGNIHNSVQPHSSSTKLAQSLMRSPMLLDEPILGQTHKSLLFYMNEKGAITARNFEKELDLIFNKKLSGGIHKGFENKEQILQSFMSFCYDVELLADVVNIVEIAFNLAGDGGNMLLYLTLGKGLNALLDIIRVLTIKTKESHQNLYELVFPYYQTLLKKPKLTSSEETWKKNASRAFHINDGLYQQVKIALEKVVMSHGDVYKDSQNWQRDPQRELDRVALHSLNFVTAINLLSDKIINLNIGYHHDNEVIALQNKFMKKLGISTDIQLTPNIQNPLPMRNSPINTASSSTKSIAHPAKATITYRQPEPNNLEKNNDIELPIINQRSKAGENTMFPRQEFEHAINQPLIDRNERFAGEEKESKSLPYDLVLKDPSQVTASLTINLHKDFYGALQVGNNGYHSGIRSLITSKEQDAKLLEHYQHLLLSASHLTNGTISNINVNDIKAGSVTTASIMKYINDEALTYSRKFVFSCAFYDKLEEISKSFKYCENFSNQSEAALQSQNTKIIEQGRTITAQSQQIVVLNASLETLKQELKDNKANYDRDRYEFERRLAQNEIAFKQELAKKNSDFQTQLDKRERDFEARLAKKDNELTTILANNQRMLEKRLDDQAEKLIATFAQAQQQGVAQGYDPRQFRRGN